MLVISRAQTIFEQSRRIIAAQRKWKTAVCMGVLFTALGDPCDAKSFYFLEDTPPVLHLIDNCGPSVLSSWRLISSIPISAGGEAVELAGGLATDPSSGQAYVLLALESRADDGNRELARVNLTTGEAVLLGNTGVQGHSFADIAFDESGVLFGVTDDGSAEDPEALFTIDKESGIPSRLDISLGRGGSGEGIAFNPGDGRLYRFSGTGFEAIDLETGTASEISISGLRLSRRNNVDAMIYAGDGSFWFETVTGVIYQVTSSGRLSSDFSLGSDLSGFASKNAGGILLASDNCEPELPIIAIESVSRAAVRVNVSIPESVARARVVASTDLRNWQPTQFLASANGGWMDRPEQGWGDARVDELATTEAALYLRVEFE